MKKLLLLLAVTLGLSGCITIKEEITLKNDGSGHYQLTMDMSKFKEIMAGFGGDDNEQMSEMSGKMDSTSTEMQKKVDGLEGISNFKNAINEDEMIMTIGFDFASVDALNNALASLGDGEGGTNKLIYNGKTIERIPMNALAALSAGDNPAAELGDGDAQQLDMIKGFMGDAEYSYTLHLPKKVKKVDNKHASFDGKTVTYSVPMFELLTNGKKIDLNTKVKLK